MKLNLGLEGLQNNKCSTKSKYTPLTFEDGVQMCAVFNELENSLISAENLLSIFLHVKQHGSSEALTDLVGVTFSNENMVIDGLKKAINWIIDKFKALGRFIVNIWNKITGKSKLIEKVAEAEKKIMEQATAISEKDVEIQNLKSLPPKEIVKVVEKNIKVYVVKEERMKVSKNIIDNDMHDCVKKVIKYLHDELGIDPNNSTFGYKGDGNTHITIDDSKYKVLGREVLETIGGAKSLVGGEEVEVDKNTCIKSIQTYSSTINFINKQYPAELLQKHIDKDIESCNKILNDLNNKNMNEEFVQETKKRIELIKYLRVYGVRLYSSVMIAIIDDCQYAIRKIAEAMHDSYYIESTSTEQ